MIIYTKALVFQKEKWYNSSIKERLYLRETAPQAYGGIFSRKEELP